MIVNGRCQLSLKVFMLCSYSGDKLTLLYIFNRDNMSRLLSSGMCSVVSVVLLFSIFSTACSSNPTTLALRSCTRQSNGKQSVSQSVNQSINQSINQSKRHLRITYMWSVERWWQHSVHSLDLVLFVLLFVGSFIFFIHIIHFNCYRMRLELPHPA